MAPEWHMGLACLTIELSTVAGGGKVKILFLSCHRISTKPVVSRGMCKHGAEGQAQAEHLPEKSSVPWDLVLPPRKRPQMKRKHPACLGTFKSRKTCNQKRNCRRRPRGKIKTQEGRCLQEKPREETISVKECKLSYEPPKHCKDKVKEATRDQGTWPQDMMAELDKSSPKWSGGAAVRMVRGDGWWK